MSSASLAGSKAGVARGAGPSDEAEASDRRLLDRFLADRDEAAFEQLVLRHGPKVLGVCRRWLGPGQDAEDAYQATFLLLATRGDSIRRPDYLGGWLCGVARRVAGRAKRKADRRRRLEGAAVDLSAVADRRGPSAGDDLRPDLRAEIERLPEKYRRPIELCYWDGLSSEQAAAMLKCPTGTLKWRLAQARENLRGRLGRAGLLSLLLGRLGRPRSAHASTTRETSRVVRRDRTLRASTSRGCEEVPARLVEDAVGLASLALEGRPEAALSPPRRRVRAKTIRKLLPMAVIAGAVLTYFSMSSPTLGRLADLVAATVAPEPVRGCHGTATSLPGADAAPASSL